MIERLKPYPKYKDSGVAWLGDVPGHWDVRRLRNTAEMRVSSVDKHTKDDEQTVRLCNYVDVYKNDRIRSGIPFMRATATRDEIERFRLQAGDVLITKDSEAWNDIGVPALVEETADDIISGYHLALLRPFSERVDGKYLFRTLQSTGVAYQFHVEAHGVTRYGLSHSAIKSVWLPIPPLPGQAAIIRFLEHADRRIRRYIHAKQKLIKLLEEQKQAIIHRAVTRGLDPKVRLKPSGVEWLGDVPEHWDVKRLHQITDPRRPVMYGIVLPGPNVDDGVYIVKGGNCEPGRLRPERLARTTFEIESRYARSRLVAGDIVFAIRGGVGAAELVPPELSGANLTQDAARIAAADSVNPHWLLYGVRAPVFREHVKSQVVGATVRGINIRSLKRIDLVMPPYEKQKEIVEHLVGATSGILAALDRAHQETSLLREYRNRLIADVVTGKLDVREAALLLPDEVEESEPTDETEVVAEGEDEPAEELDTVTDAADA
jgi:type I restriction enzyme, S subunit